MIHLFLCFYVRYKCDKIIAGIYKYSHLFRKFMKKLIVGLLTAFALFVGLLANTSSLPKNPPNDGGVFITDEVGDGPIFYPASYSTEISDEPSYSTQNSYTFSSMNYNQAHKFYRGDSVKVAVIDSGLNYTHEDFEDANGNQIIQGNSRTIDSTSGSWLYYHFLQDIKAKSSTL